MQLKTFREMKCRRLGASGLWVSEIGLGLWKWGDPAYDGSKVGEADGFRILDRALELGVLHWDTANSYNLGAGNSERLLGRYFASRGDRIRDQVVLATKIANAVRDEREMVRDFTPNERGASRRYILRAVDDCLKRLRTDRIDLLYLHFPQLLPDGSWETPPEETWDAMNALVTAGKVMYLAVSNVTTAQIETFGAALAAVSHSPARRLIAVQNGYNLAERQRVTAEKAAAVPDADKAFLAFLEQNGLGLVPYFPLAAGLLSGRYRRDNLDTVTGRLVAEGEEFKRRYLSPAALILAERLSALTERKGCTPAQLALAWLLAQSPVASVIAGVTKLEQLEDNARAPNLNLTTAELAELDQMSHS